MTKHNENTTSLSAIMSEKMIKVQHIIKENERQNR